LHAWFHFATVRRPRPLLRGQPLTPLRNDRSDAAGAGRPSVAPAEGYGPRFPRVGAVAALSAATGAQDKLRQIP
jgi:hypothetical protein